MQRNDLPELRHEGHGDQAEVSRQMGDTIVLISSPMRRANGTATR